MEELMVRDIGEKLEEMLDNIEAARAKSKNIKEGISRIIKTGIKNAKILVAKLVDRTGREEEAERLLRKELRICREESERLKGEVRRLEERIEDLEKREEEVRKIRTPERDAGRIESISLEMLGRIENELRRVRNENEYIRKAMDGNGWLKWREGVEEDRDNTDTRDKRAMVEEERKEWTKGTGKRRMLRFYKSQHKRGNPRGDSKRLK